LGRREAEQRREGADGVLEGDELVDEGAVIRFEVVGLGMFLVLWGLGTEGEGVQGGSTKPGSPFSSVTFHRTFGSFHVNWPQMVVFMAAL
jgi:hypothetical protein